MLDLLLRMSGATLFYVLVAVTAWRFTSRRKLRLGGKILLGLLFGGCSVLSTHFGVNYDNMVLNVRDLGPLAAALFFDPLSGIIAGVIGGVERYLASVLWNIGNYTRIACSVSTVLAGLLAALLNRYIFRGKTPRALNSFLMGAVVEVFHMYAVFLTHRDDVTTAYTVVRTCALPMIVFTGLGLAVCSMIINALSGKRPLNFRRQAPEQKELSYQFQYWMLVATSIVFLINFAISYSLSTQTAMEEARYKLNEWTEDIKKNINASAKSLSGLSDFMKDRISTDAKLVSQGIQIAGGVHQVSPELLDKYRILTSSTGLYTMDSDGKMIAGSGDPWSNLKNPESPDDPLGRLRSGGLTADVMLDDSSESWYNAVVPCGDGYVRLAFDFYQQIENFRFTQLQGVFTNYELTDEADFYLFTRYQLDPANPSDYDTYLLASSMADPVTFNLTEAQEEQLLKHVGEPVFSSDLFGYPALCRFSRINDLQYTLVLFDAEEAFSSRDAQVYENAFSDLLVFAAIFIMVTILMESMVNAPLHSINASLNRIISGDLDETLSVNTSIEFDHLSKDINQTVSTLKTYIGAAEQRMAQELLMAKTIQAAALPRAFDIPRDEVRLYALMDPAKEVGGDFYDFFFVGPNRLALVIADVSGKGIPAALFMMRSKTAIRNLAENGKSPAEIFSQANHLLCDGNDAEMFVTAWIGILDLKTGDMVCANAGHEYPAILRAGGDYELLKDKHSLALAAMDGIPMKEYSLRLNPGDSLFVYTDGVPEAINEAVEQYGTDRLLEELNLHKDKPPKILLPLVRENLRRFVGKADQFDDITMLGVSFLGHTENPL